MDDQWELGLPPIEELTPLTQSLISPELALAFAISPDNYRPLFDLNKVMHDTCSTVCPKEDSFDAINLRLVSAKSDIDSSGKVKRGDSFLPDEVNSGSKDDNCDENGGNRAVKRPRLVWTPQLHKRFVDVIEHLGVDKAVPKTIMEMMNVEGLTRENVASHLQKYRLYLKRVEGLANEGHSSSRRTPSFFDCDGFGSISTPMPVALPPPLMAYGGGAYGNMGLGLGVGMGESSASPVFNCGLESGAFNVFWSRQRG